MSPIESSVFVSCISMTVIFITLSTLIFVIKALVKWMPYVPPPAKPVSSSGSAETSEHIAVIHSALAHYLKKAPNEIQITNIRSL
jgi:Na+-transporting methylmalonyl-CoA/oxaloacetate decarboxylase gamma subunit